MKIALKYLLKLKFCKVDGYLFSMFTYSCALRKRGVTIVRFSQ